MPSLIPFTFDDHQIRVQVDEHGKPWWVAKDVCETLGIQNVSVHQKINTETYSVIDMLGIASSLDVNETSFAFAFLIWISECVSALNVDGPSFWAVYRCVAAKIATDCKHEEQNPDEFYWHKVFRKHVEALIPGASIVPRKRIDGSGYPDFLVKVENDICPVEIKRKDFNRTAYKQLRNYILEYEAPYGFAVAQNITTSLDANMIYVSLKGLAL